MKLERNRGLLFIRKFLAVCVASLLAVSMMPAASFGVAFAAQDGLSQHEADMDDTESVDDADIADSTEAEAEEAEGGAPEDGGGEEQEAADAAEPFEVEDEEYEPPTSFRYDNGVPITSDNVMSRSIGTNYPSYFPTYDSGYHQRSDAARGLDVSYYQGNINWAQVAAYGIDFVIIRSSDGFSFDDPKFGEYVRGCMTQNIPFGVYHYARATNADEANREADHVFRQLAAAGVTPSNITYPIYYDIENSGSPNYWNLGQGTVDTIVRTFIGRMNAAGYKAGVYSSTSWFEGGPCGSSYINSLEYRWCAQYNSAGLTYGGFGSGGNALKNNGKGMWQFTSAGRVDGISGNVDMDYSYLFSNGVFSVSGNVVVDSIDKDGGTFRIVAKNIKSNKAINDFGFYVWCSSQNGQDDLRWYKAARNSDGTFTACVAIKDHKGYTGSYAIHAYAYSRSGQCVGREGELSASFNMTVNPKSMTRGEPVNNASVPVTAKGGDYACATAVSIKAWLQTPVAGSSGAVAPGTVVWHTMNKPGSAWVGSVNLHHHRAAGTYQMEVYATVNGVQRLVDSSTFYISSYSDPGVVMYRLYNPGLSQHHYTSNAAERDDLVRYHGWVYEGVGWIAASGGTPVYRLYNPGLGDHHYTSSASEKEGLVRYHGWNYEGIGWYTDGFIPVYRQYNGGLKTGQHHYTVSKAEYDVNIAKNGWKPEGIGWYALRAK